MYTCIHVYMYICHTHVSSVMRGQERSLPWHTHTHTHTHTPLIVVIMICAFVDAVRRACWLFSSLASPLNPLLRPSRVPSEPGRCVPRSSQSSLNSSACQPSTRPPACSLIADYMLTAPPPRRCWPRSSLSSARPARKQSCSTTSRYYHVSYYTAIEPPPGARCLNAY
jgi:hypothetical protein